MLQAQIHFNILSSCNNSFAFYGSYLFNLNHVFLLPLNGVDYTSKPIKETFQNIYIYKKKKKQKNKQKDLE